MRFKTVGAIGLITAAALIGGCQPAQQPPPPPAMESEPLKLEAPQPAQKPAATTAAQPKKAVAKASQPNSTPAKAVADKTAPALTIAHDAKPASTAAMEPRAAAQKEEKDDEQPIITTIVGCLENDGGIFRLKDTEGDHAPRSRSWKSGFIRKGSAKVELIDATNRLKLPSHVGYRVRVGGTLVDREMHASSVRATSERCD
jgi:hypothetical protein